MRRPAFDFLWTLAALFALGCARTAETAPTRPPLSAAATEPSVRVYSATWCKACHALDAALTAKGIVHATVDIDEDKAAFRAAQEATGSVVLPLTRVTSRRLVGWIEGANVDVIEAVAAWKGDAGPGVIFAWYDGQAEYVRIDGAAVETTTNRTVNARTVAAAVRVASGLRKSPTTVARVQLEGDAHPKGLELWGFGNLPVPWNETRAGELDRSLLLDFAEHADQGHVEARVDRVRVTLAPYERVIVTLHESEGPRWRVHHVHVLEHDGKGKPVAPLGGESKLRGHVALADGAWFDRTKFVTGLSAIRSDYQEAGYYEVEDDIDYVRTQAGDHLDVDFAITLVRGPRVVIDTIVVDAEGVEASVVRAKLGLKEGELLRPSLLEAARKKLLESGVATRVEVSTKRTVFGKVNVHFEAYRETAKL